MQFDTSLKKRGLYLRRACFRVLLRWSVLAFAPQPHHHSRCHHRRVPRDRRVSIKRRWRQFYAVQFNDLRGRKREASISVWRRKLHPPIIPFAISYYTSYESPWSSIRSKKKKKKNVCNRTWIIVEARDFFVWPGRDPSLFLSFSLFLCDGARRLPGRETRMEV